ncbi:MAG TPA: glycine zipper 2TM domain-containing protein [Steroidobacteraceae bacterium]
MTHHYRTFIAAVAAVATLALQMPAYADPPSWTPAGENRDQGDRPDDQRDKHRDKRRDDRQDQRRDDRRDERRDDRQDDHGYGGYYHREGHRYYRGYRGDDWGYDYGVYGGRCDTNAVLGVAGAVTGAIIGNNNASPENRGIATVFGAIAGGIIGNAVGDAIDEGDRGCLGQSFELARIGSPVVWVNPRSRVAWRVIPLRDVSSDCREFELRRGYGGRFGRERVVACRRGRGDWAFRDR